MSQQTKRDPLTLDRYVRTAIQVALLELDSCASPDRLAAAEDRGMERAAALLEGFGRLELGADVVESLVGATQPKRTPAQYEAGVIITELIAGLGVLSLLAVAYVGVRLHSITAVAVAGLVAGLWILTAFPRQEHKDFPAVRFPDDEPALRPEDEPAVCLGAAPPTLLKRQELRAFRRVRHDHTRYSA